MKIVKIKGNDIDGFIQSCTYSIPTDVIYVKSDEFKILDISEEGKVILDILLELKKDVDLIKNKTIL